MTLTHRVDLLIEWKNAIDTGNFRTPERDPSQAGSAGPGSRTVTEEVLPGIELFLTEGEFTLRKYRDNNPRHPDDFYQLIPHNTGFVARSGILPNASDHAHPCDCLVIAAGEHRTWHLYAEEASRVRAKESNGDLTFLEEVH